MIRRITQGWSFRRALYLLIGLAIVIQSAYTHEWVGIAVGTYFASMGLFGFGCAGGNCGFVPRKSAPETKEEISFEEVA